MDNKPNKGERNNIHKKRCYVMNKSLTELYDEIKAEVSPRPVVTPSFPLATTGPLQNSPGALAWRNQAANQCEVLKDQCAKKILLDIYCRVIPLDSEYVTGNQGMMKADIDKFLTNKNMTGTQYLTSCREKTNAPLLEFIIRSCNNIGKQFMKEADETLKDAQEKDIQVPPPVADADDEETQNQLVDVQKDQEYESFIDTLKKKTIDKIVDDVTKVIENNKETQDMTFAPNPDSGDTGMDDTSFESVDDVTKAYSALDAAKTRAAADKKGKDVKAASDVKKLQTVFDTAVKKHKQEEKEFKDSFKKDTTPPESDDVPAKAFNNTPSPSNPALQDWDSPRTESAVSVVIDHIHETLWKEGENLTPQQEDQVIGLAIRESVLNMIDITFKQPDSEFRPFRSKIRFGKGIVANESAIKEIKDSKDRGLTEEEKTEADKLFKKVGKDTVQKEIEKDDSKSEST